jgi:hypothetical protein
MRPVSREGGGSIGTLTPIVRNKRKRKALVRWEPSLKEPQAKYRRRSGKT